MSKNPNSLREFIHVTEALGGGVLKVLTQLIEVQSDEGYKTTLIYLQRADTPRLEELKSKFLTTQIHCLGDSSILGMIKLSWVLVGKKWQATSFFHFHSSWAGFLGRIVIQIFKKNKMFYSPHGYSFLRTDIGKLSRISFQNLEKMLSKISRARIIAFGKHEASLSKKMKAKDFVEAKHYIEVSECDQPHQTVKCLKKEMIIICVGRITNAKRPERFAELALQQKDHANLVWVGDGDLYLKRKLIDSGVEVTGWLTPAEVSQKMSEADIFMLLSDWEGLPFSVLEAMTFSLPVILWNFPGASDLVSDNFNGFVCDSIESLKESSLNLIQNPKLLEEFGQRAKTKVQSEFSKEEYQKTWRSWYL